jgi:hypothetical protein
MLFSEYKRASPTYVLRGRTPVLEPVYDAWCEWFRTADRVVASSELPNGVLIDTYFLGTDYGTGTDRPPILFHTYIHDGPRASSYWLEPTWSMAEKRHFQVVEEELNSEEYP